MHWKKLGKIYQPDGSLSWSQSHAQVPVADYIENENIVRVYFSTRDEQNRSMPGMIELDAENLFDIKHIGNKPLMELGALGTFDDCGVMPSWIITHDDKKYMYYIGWNVRNTIAYHNSVGLAISSDNGKSFEKFSEGPLWDRDYKEPQYSGTSCVLIDDDGTWKNWYLSCTEWRIVNGKSEPRYHIKYGESKDGINWVRKGTIAIDYRNNDEAGIVKASVIKENGLYKMWYSYRNFADYRTDRSNSYRIGYAESINGIDWERKDSLSGITVAENENEWDGLMTEYPHVVDIKGKRYMFYNGNGFGQSGFGVAVLEK